MKTLKLYTALFLSSTLFFGCKKEGNYPGGVVSPYISIFDIKELYRGKDVSLTADKMFGSTQITAMVVSDHSGGNMPAGLVVVQEARRLSQLRGISINIGADAANYVPGDSVTIKVEGGVLKRVNGILQITGVPAGAVKKISSGNSIPVNRVASNLILADPGRYESVLAVIVKGGFNPLPGRGEVLSGDKMLNDGFGDLTLHTGPAAKFSNSTPIFLGNYTGIVFNTVQKDTLLVPQFRLRTKDDIVLLSSTVQVTPVIITGFMSDVVSGTGNDANYEYIQLMATQDINFAATPYSVVTCNNANASTPAGYPANGWATGGLRTYKFNLTSGTAPKGSFFYVGGSARVINGINSTSMASSNWIRAYNYSTTDGEGFGTRTTNLLANSGNAFGIAVFSGTTITASTAPVDVIFIATGGSLFTSTPNSQGYKIANTDWYDIINPITLEEQPYYRSGSNTINLGYNTADIGYFNMLGGEYNTTLGRWMKARSQKNVVLSKSSAITEIEGEGVTRLLR